MAMNAELGEPCAEVVAGAYAAIGEVMTRGLGEDATCIRRPGASLLVTGAPDASLNSLFLSPREADPAVAVELLDLLAETRAPCSVKLRPGAAPDFLELMAGRGLVLKYELPLMVLERADFVPAGPSSQARLRRVAPDDAEGHLALVSEGLQLRREAVDRLFSPANMSLPCWRAYVAEVAGDVAATGVAVTAAGHVCLMGIVTAPAHRNRGHAAALTTRAVQDGLAAGAERAFLHASEMGAGLYRKLGFREVERWGIWTTGD